MGQNKIYEDLKAYEPSGFLAVGDPSFDVEKEGDMVFDVFSSASDKEYRVHIVSDSEVRLYTDKSKVDVFSGKAVNVVSRALCQNISFGDGRLEVPLNGMMPEGFGPEFKNCIIYPKTILNNHVVFADHNGREWILSSDEPANVTLSLYHLLVDESQEEYALKMVQLEAKDKVKLETVKASANPKGFAKEVVRSQISDRAQQLRTNSHMLKASRVVGADTYTPVRGETVDLLNSRQTLLHNENVMLRLSGKRPVKASRDVSVPKQGDDFTAVLIKQSHDGKITIAFGKNVGDTTREIWSQCRAQVEKAELQVVLSKAGFKLQDTRAGVGIFSEDFKGTLEFDKWKELLLDSCVLNREVPARVKVNSAFRLDLKEVRYDTVKVDGSCLVRQGKEVVKSSMKEEVAKMDLPAMFESMDQIRYLRA